MEKFAELINNTAEPVLVDFYATWCGPCKMMHPILENVKARVGNKARIVKIDVDETAGVAAVGRGAEQRAGRTHRKPDMKYEVLGIRY